MDRPMYSMISAFKFISLKLSRVLIEHVHDKYHKK